MESTPRGKVLRYLGDLASRQASQYRCKAESGNLRLYGYATRYDRMREIFRRGLDSGMFLGWEVYLDVEWLIDREYKRFDNSEDYMQSQFSTMNERNMFIGALGDLGKEWRERHPFLSRIPTWD